MSIGFDTVLGMLKGVHRSGDKADARCPAHDDRTASLSVGVGHDGRILLKCHAGCLTESVVAALGLTFADLSPERTNGDTRSNGHAQSNGKGITLEEFARAKCLPIDFLRSMHVEQQGRALLFRHLLMDGQPAPRQHIRVSMTGKRRFWWAGEKSEKVGLYGLWRLAEFREAGAKTLVLLEGESDSLTAWLHGIPALGIPGADCSALLQAVHLEGFAYIVIARENDAKGGETFERKTVERLAQLEFRGHVAVVEMAAFGDEVKDLNDVHRKLRGDRDEFLRAWAALTALARPIDLSDVEIDAREPEPQREDGTAELVTIDVTIEDLPKLTAEAWLALKATNEPPRMFLHGGPMRLETDDDDDDAPVLKALTEDRMRHELARAANWVKRKKKNPQPVPPPSIIARDMLAAPTLDLPRLTRIVETPVFTASHKLICAPGFHPETGIFYRPRADLNLWPISEKPSDEEIKAARGLWLDELLGDFTFKGDADKAHAIALPLQNLVRELIKGPTPLHAFESPGPGHGKGLLLDVAVRCIFFRVGLLTETRNDDEWRKRITSALRAGRAVVLIDNVRFLLNSGVVSAAITATEWGDRLLGQNELISVPVRCAWAMTGNNLNLSDEIARRTVPTRIDTNRDRPWERDPSTFKHPELRQWAAEHRSNLIAALLTLAQAWIVRGCPKPKTPTLGSFEDWSRVIGGILETAQIPGFLGNCAELYDRADRQGALWRALVDLWWERFKDGGVTATADLLPLALELDLDLGQADDNHARRIAFGKKLGAHCDRVLGDFKITKAGTKNRAVLWKLVRVRETAQ